MNKQGNKEKGDRVNVLRIKRQVTQDGVEVVWGHIINGDLGGLHGGGDIQSRTLLDRLLTEDIRTQVRGDGCTEGSQCPVHCGGSPSLLQPTRNTDAEAREGNTPSP